MCQSYSESDSDSPSSSSCLSVEEKSLENSQAPITHEGLQKNTEKIKLIIENQNETLKLNLSGKTGPPGLSLLLDSIESMLADESSSLLIDLVFVSFEFMRIAKFILKSFELYDSRITSTVKTPDDLSGINSISDMDSVALHSYSHSEIVRKNTEEMKNIFNDSRDQLKEIAEGMNNEADFKKKISSKLRIFDRDFMGPYTSTAVMLMVMELVNQMFMVLKNCEANEDIDQEINDSNHDAGDFDLQGENNHAESIHGLRNILLNEFGKMEKMFIKFDELQPYSESWIAQNENLIQEIFQAIVAKLEESKNSTIEISTCMTQTIVKSDKIVKGLFF